MRARVLTRAAEIEAAAPRVHRLAAAAGSDLASHRVEVPLIHHRHFHAEGGLDYGSRRGRNVFGCRSWLLDPAWILVEDGDDLAGVAPLFVHEALLTRRGPRVRLLSFPADSQVIYYQDLLVHPARREAAVGAIFAAIDALVTREDDLVFLGHIPDASPNLPAIRRELGARRARGWSGFEATNLRRGGVLPWTLPDLSAALRRAREAVTDEAQRARMDALLRDTAEAEPSLVAFPGTRRALEEELGRAIRGCAETLGGADHARRIVAAIADAPIVYPYLELPDRPDAVLESFGPSNRACHRRRGRRFAEAGGRFEVVEPSAITAPDVREHLDLHRARWGGESVALSSATAAYHEDLALALAGAGVLRLFFARHGGARVASLSCFDVGRRRECFNAGRSPAADALRAGKLLMLHAMIDAVERGLAVFDLGYGGFAYKLELTRQSRTVKSFLLGRGALPSADDLFAGYERIVEPAAGS